MSCISTFWVKKHLQFHSGPPSLLILKLNKVFYTSGQWKGSKKLSVCVSNNFKHDRSLVFFFLIFFPKFLLYVEGGDSLWKLPASLYFIFVGLPGPKFFWPFWFCKQWGKKCKKQQNNTLIQSVLSHIQF